MFLSHFPPLASVTPWQRDCRRGTMEKDREIALWFVVIWSLILTDPYQPPAHCSLFILLLHQTEWPAGWLEDMEALSLLTTLKQPPLTSIINNDTVGLITENIPPLQLRLHDSDFSTALSWVKRLRSWERTDATLLFLKSEMLLSYLSSWLPLLAYLAF